MSFVISKLPVSFYFPQSLLCSSMPHKELVVYVEEYVVKNDEGLKPIALSLLALCWPHMGKLDEVVNKYTHIRNYCIMLQAMDALLNSCPDPIIEYSITIFGQKLKQVVMNNTYIEINMYVSVESLTEQDPEFNITTGG